MKANQIGIGIAIAGAMLATGCATEESTAPVETAEAGAAAAELGIASYDVEQDGAAVRVRLFDSDGAELGLLSVERVGSLIPAIEDVDMGEIQAHYQFHLRYEGIGAEQGAVELDGDTHAVKYVSRATTPWLATLTDPALAEPLSRLNLTWRVGKPTAAGVSPDLDQRVSIENEDGYSGEYACCGHRVGADGHVPDWPYFGCGGNCTTTFPQWIPAWGDHCAMFGGFTEHGITRICNTACCANGDCMSTGGGSPCGAPYGPSGCYVQEHWDWHDPC